MDMDEDRSMWKIWDVTNRSIVVIMLAIVPTAIFYVVSCCYCWTTSNGLPGILPDILTYKTCVYTPPGFSPGCMDNVTVYPGGTATFNCQVEKIFPFFKVHKFWEGNKNSISTKQLFWRYYLTFYWPSQNNRAVARSEIEITGGGS